MADVHNTKTPARMFQTGGRSYKVSSVNNLS